MKKFLQKMLQMVCVSFLLSFVLFPITAKADMGPKPSVVVEFTGAEGKTYYVTLLSEQEHRGPYSVWEGGRKPYEESDSRYPIWEKFVQYKDADGYYFLERFDECSESHWFAWTYYPPEKFKVLCYFPDTDTFAVSDVYERYAFDSYYAVDLSEKTIAPDTEQGEGAQKDAPTIVLENNYNYVGEAFALILRILLTVLLEVGLAWLFGFRKKWALLCIAIVNVITQVGFNVFLNVIQYQSGALAFLIVYFLGEMFVFMLEVVVFLLVLRKQREEQEKSYGIVRIICYTICANLLSFVAGVYLALLLPIIF